jgi:peptidoglycan/LPS O-acetylase OafA/YrhL
MRRIFPALAVVLATSFALGWYLLLAEEYKQLGRHIAGGAGFVSNLLLWQDSGYFDATAEARPLLHLWSLGVEEQFYIAWPILLVPRVGSGAPRLSCSRPASASRPSA